MSTHLLVLRAFSDLESFNVQSVPTGTAWHQVDSVKRTNPAARSEPTGFRPAHRRLWTRLITDKPSNSIIKLDGSGTAATEGLIPIS